MLGKIHAVVLDCPLPQELANFYQRVLGGEVSAEDDTWVNLLIPGENTKLSFQLCPGYVAPRWPGEDGDQQVHLDIAVESLEVAHEHLLALGARFVEGHSGFRVYLDPAGHPFCTVD